LLKQIFFFLYKDFFISFTEQAIKIYNDMIETAVANKRIYCVSSVVFDKFFINISRPEMNVF